jgi:ABC-type sugar transport system ATPase subunit
MSVEAIPYVNAIGVRMTFGPVVALNGADLTVAEGTIEGVVGHNGAGKSTLISVLCGAQMPNGGTITVRGEPFAGGSVLEAERRGVVLVPQRTSLFDDISVLDNLLTPRRFPTRAGGLISWRSARAAARAALRKVALSVDLDARAGVLTVHERRALMIARALLREPALLILDEPTEAFAEAEVAQLFGVVREMVADGMTVIYVSHRLDEILDLASHVTIMRAGTTVGRVPAEDLDRHELVELMLGAEAPAVAQLERAHHELREGVTPVISLRNLTTHTLAGVSLEVRPGEIVGLYGLAGAGQSEILRAVAGMRPDTRGEIRLHGEPVSGSVGARRGRGLSLVSSDLGADASLHGLTVRENVVIGVPGGVRSRRALPVVSRAAEARLAREALERVGLGASRLEARVESLSGGMQQKVMLARSIVNGSCVWLMDEPMTGLDVHSRVDLTSLLRRLVSDIGADERPRAAIAVLSDYEDLAMLCDRVYVVRDGRVVGEYHAGEFDEHALVHSASFDQAA